MLYSPLKKDPCVPIGRQNKTENWEFICITFCLLSSSQLSFSILHEKQLLPLYFLLYVSCLPLNFWSCLERIWENLRELWEQTAYCSEISLKFLSNSLREKLGHETKWNWKWIFTKELSAVWLNLHFQFLVVHVLSGLSIFNAVLSLDLDGIRFFGSGIFLTFSGRKLSIYL